MTRQVLTPDICVIGGGAGGVAVATMATAFGVPVVLVEQSKMGGEHLNYGCVPSKALLAVARRFAGVTGSAAFGIAATGSVDFAQVRAHMRTAIAAVTPTVSAERLGGMGIRVVRGTAQFTGRVTVAVGDDIEIKARRFVIATGSSPAMPLTLGFEAVDYLTNETIFDLAELPTHLIVVGGGAIGLELAQAFRRFGSAVTVLEAQEPLGGEEPECVDAVVAALAREGIAIHAGANVKDIARAGSGVAVTFEAGGVPHKLEGTHLLLATGRRPNIEALDLAAAGIKIDAGGIRVDKRLKSSNRKVYAIGDVIGGPRLTNAAEHHAGLVVRNALFRLPVNAERSAIPRVTFTDPELAQVGLTEVAARRKYGKLRILRWSYHDNDRAQAESRTHGQIKVIATRKGRILGASIVGAQAGELITAWSLAIGQGLNIRAMADMIVPYPTLGEIGKRAAQSYFLAEAMSPRLRRIVGWLRKLG